MKNHPDAILTALLTAAVRGEPPPGGALAALLAFTEAAKAVLLPGHHSDHARLSLQARVGCEAIQLLSEHLRACALTDRELLRMQEGDGKVNQPEKG